MNDYNTWVVVLVISVAVARTALFLWMVRKHDDED